jgi:RNA polymerase sigma-70 factor, ECF subfamily
MVESRGRRGTKGAAEASEELSVAVGSRSVAESQLVARTILERGRRRDGGPLAQLGAIALDGMALDGTPLDETLPLVGPGAGDTAAAVSAPHPEEFLQLFHEYERYVASIGTRILGPNNGVDDLVQDVFLVIYQEFHKLRELSSIKAWLATIATRLAWRQRGRPWLFSKLSLTQVEELSPLESPDASPELQADLASLLERLRAMPTSLRDPWLLRFIDGETLPRIAELCSCSQSTVQRRLREAGELMLGQAKAPGQRPLQAEADPQPEDESVGIVLEDLVVTRLGADRQ